MKNKPFSGAAGGHIARFACMSCCKKGAINLIRRYSHRFFIEFHRIFGFFVPNRLGLVEIYPKCFLNFFFEFFFEVEIWRQSRNFRILQQIFKYFFRRIFGNLKVLDRDSGLYSPTVKRESKNSSIHPKNDRSKIAKFSAIFLDWKQGQLVGSRSRAYEQLEVRAKKRSTALDPG